MNVNAARTIARLAHAGQKYGTQDYFTAHVEAVVRRCEEHTHCTYGHVVLAYVHDVLEDTSLTDVDLQDLGFEGHYLDALRALTRSDDEPYRDYIGRVLENGTATFVKYHDVLVNMEACERDLKDRIDPVRKARAVHLLYERYGPTLERIRATKPYWLYEEASERSYQCS